MALYGIDGKEATALYDIHGNEVVEVFDIHGNAVVESKSYDLIVMSYNVQKQGAMNNANLQKEIIAKYKPNVIGMQEYRVSFEEAGHYFEYPYTVNNSAALQNYDGILSKYELKDTGGTVFTVKYADPSGYVFGTFSYHGKEIYVLNVHLSPYGDDYSVYREPEIQEVLELVNGKDYFIIIGDFNCHTVQDETSAEYVALLKPFVDMGCHLANNCQEFGFNDTYTGSKTIENAVWTKIDNIITSPNIEIVNAVVDKTKLNYVNGNLEIDHLPVVAYLEVN